MGKEVILTGLRSNDEFHLGNYLGAIMPMVELQRKYAGRYQFNMFIPDLHSFTTPVDHAALYQQSLKNLQVFVAAGLDINQADTFIYRQSYVAAHSELTWILGCFTYYGELTRMTQFKDQAGLSESQIDSIVDSINQRMTQQGIWGQIGDATSLEDQKRLLDIATRPFIQEIRDTVQAKGEHSSASLLLYPVLMAADILLYGAMWVPVGDDQRQHLELTRNIAIRMNNKFGNLFQVPKSWDEHLKFFGLDKGIRIRSLRQPGNKMSKSVDDPAGTIKMSDLPEEAAKKIMSATTDSKGVIRLDWDAQPGIANLLQILSLLQNKPLSEMVDQWEGQTNYEALKSQTAEAAKSFLADFQAQLAKVDEAQMVRKLEADETKVNEVAASTLLKVQKAVGLRPA